MTKQDNTKTYWFTFYACHNDFDYDNSKHRVHYITKAGIPSVYGVMIEGISRAAAYVDFAKSVGCDIRKEMFVSVIDIVEVDKRPNLFEGFCKLDNYKGGHLNIWNLLGWNPLD